MVYPINDELLQNFIREFISSFSNAHIFLGVFSCNSKILSSVPLNIQPKVAASTLAVLRNTTGNGFHFCQGCFSNQQRILAVVGLVKYFC